MSSIENQWKQISTALNQRRLPQAWLLLGPLPFVLNQFALQAVQFILCPEKLEDAAGFKTAPCMHCSFCQMVEGLEHPDLQWIKPEKAGGVIKIDQIRSLLEDAYLTPHLGERRIIVIEGAHRMNLASANALLKILEEPCAHTHFILIAQQKATILPTVISRTQIINFSLSEELTAKNLLALGDLYAADSEQAKLMEHAEIILGDLIELLEQRKHPSNLALSWQQYELERLLWFLYLTYSQLLYLFYYPAPVDGKAREEFLKLKTLVNPFLLCKQIDKINVLQKKINSNVSANSTLALEDLLFALISES